VFAKYVLFSVVGFAVLAAKSGSLSIWCG